MKDYDKFLPNSSLQALKLVLYHEPVPWYRRLRNWLKELFGG